MGTNGTNGPHKLAALSESVVVRLHDHVDRSVARLQDYVEDSF